MIWIISDDDLNYSEDFFDKSSGPFLKSSRIGLCRLHAIVSKEALIHKVDHNLEILRSCWKGNDACASEPRVYNYEEESATTIKYLKNHHATIKQSFIEVSKNNTCVIHETLMEYEHETWVSCILSNSTTFWLNLKYSQSMVRINGLGLVNNYPRSTTLAIA